MTETADRNLRHLPPATAALGHILARPRWIAAACVIALSGLAWAYLGLITASVPDAFAVLCRPIVTTGVQSDVLVLAMWCAMALAMMLPSAAPMIFTYAEIADTAARKGERIVSPFVLAAGYSAVWFGFGALAALGYIVAGRFVALELRSDPIGALFSGAIFLGAGAYQFSTLKQACLHQCQRPFQFFFTRWETTPRGVFRLALKQGLYCLGCCWAMMAVMFAVGAMNIIWMAAFGIVMTIEKMTITPRFSQALGVAMIAAGIAFVVIATSGVKL